MLHMHFDYLVFPTKLHLYLMTNKQGLEYRSDKKSISHTTLIISTLRDLWGSAFNGYRYSSCLVCKDR